METSQPLAIESFSYSWLVNRKPSLEGLNEPLRTSLDWLINRNPSSDGLNEPHRTSLDCSEEATSEETKYKMVMSKRFSEEAQNFNFDIPISRSPAAFVHADEIFSDGHIIPIYVDRSNIEAFSTSNSVPAIPVSSLSSRTVCPADRSHCHFLRKWRKSSNRILQKYFGFLRPLCRKAGCSRKSIKVDDIDRKVWEVKSWSNSPQASPSYSTGDWCDVESSIYEAILHCKRSIEK